MFGKDILYTCQGDYVATLFIEGELCSNVGLIRYVVEPSNDLRDGSAVYRLHCAAIILQLKPVSVTDIEQTDLLVKCSESLRDARLHKRTEY